MGKSSSDLVGRTIAGKFVVEDIIGSGAMGAVYRARQVALDKVVAIKVLHGEHADDATFAARFQREAKAASRLNHPNSMQVIDFGEEPDGLLYIAMEYLDGRSLHRVLREDRPLPAARTADVLMQTLAALAVAHDMGVVHRDLKPENIMVLQGTDDDGRPRDIIKVCDFGIAKITDSRAYKSGSDRESNAPVTTAGFLVGTPEYMSPEQGRGEKLDARSDLYSVGVVLYEILAGQPPFEAENAIGVVLRHITEAPVAPSQVAPGVDPRLEGVCMRAMRKPREERYQSAREMRSDLRAAMEGRPMQHSSPDMQSARILTSTPAPATAATIEMELPSRPRILDEAGSKPTFAGTTAPVPGTPGRRRAALVGAVAAVGVGLGFLSVMALRSHGPSTAPVIVASAAPGETSIEAEPLAGGDVPPLEATSGQPGAWAHGPVSFRPGHAPSGKPVPSSSATPAIAPPQPSAAPQPAAPPPSVASAPPPAPVAAPDPDFDPERAYVEIGLINAQGVRERAIRAALRGIGFAGCYRKALHARGSRAVGTATLDLSIDEGGAARSAIVGGAEFLPGLTRCLQGAASGVSVPRSQVDSGGGTAEVTLAFRAP